MEGWARAGWGEKLDAMWAARTGRSREKTCPHLNQYNDSQSWVATGGVIIIRLQDSPAPPHSWLL